LELQIGDTKTPKRGHSAFQADICIFERVGDVEFPRVAIEFKGSITTHDILTYSAKAGNHKKIYPCLRYGLLASKIDRIPGSVFIHNENLDFFIAAKRYKSKAAIRPFAKKLIEKEIKISKTLEEIHFGDATFDYWLRDVVFTNFDKT
jgi:hypothetical protein